MSVVVGILTEERAVVASDSLFSGDGCVSHHAPKVWKIGDYLIGIAGYTTLIQRMLPELQRGLTGDADPADVMRAAWDVCAAAVGPSTDRYPSLGMEVLLIGRGRLLVLEQDRSVVEHAERGHAAIGTGGQLAYGALAALKDMPEIAAKAVFVVGIVAKHAATVGGPVQMLTTDWPVEQVR